MATLRKSGKTLDAQVSPSNDRINENAQTKAEHTQKISGYEQYRENIIKENRERMQKLGIFDLSLKFKSVKPTRNSSSNKKKPRCLSPLPSPIPTRRSSRLQNVVAVIYDEEKLSKKNTSLEGDLDLLGEGSKPEGYTDKHQKLLGNADMSWTLFVDGVGPDGKRIYDSVNGKTCHQCRQKTLGHRTHCSQCGMLRGQFCGDCLYMRYGEHILEANQNPNWICPVCRGICNCSFCRQAKGLPPTGLMYRKISKLGFKSVAHYLIQTGQSQPDSNQSPGTKLPALAKKSLPFSDVETASEGNKSPIHKDDQLSLVTWKCEDSIMMDDEFKGEEVSVGSKHGATDIVPKSSQETNTKSAPTLELNLSMPACEDKKEEKLQVLGYKENDNRVEPESSPNLKRKSRRCIAEPTPDSIHGRKRQRPRTADVQAEELLGSTDETLECGTLANISSIISSVDSIGGRLRLRSKRT